MSTPLVLGELGWAAAPHRETRCDRQPCHPWHGIPASCRDDGFGRAPGFRRSRQTPRASSPVDDAWTQSRGVQGLTERCAPGSRERLGDWGSLIYINARKPLGEPAPSADRAEENRGNRGLGPKAKPPFSQSHPQLAAFDGESWSYTAVMMQAARRGWVSPVEGL